MDYTLNDMNNNGATIKEMLEYLGITPEELEED